MNTEAKAVDMILDKGVAWSLTAPSALRLIGVKKIKVRVRALRFGTLLEMSRLAALAGIDKYDDEQVTHETRIRFSKPVAEMAALAILNSRLRIRLFKGFMTRLLMSATQTQLSEILMVSVAMSQTSAFQNTIRLIREMKVTTPKNLSPEDRGSHG